MANAGSNGYKGDTPFERAVLYRLERMDAKVDRLWGCFDSFLSVHQSDIAKQVRRDLKAPLPKEEKIE